MKCLLVLVVCISVALAYPSTYAEAETCTASKCGPNNGCVCSSENSPIDITQTPQFVVLTVDDSVNTDDQTNIFSKLLFNRKNNDGTPIGATFYVPHDYTNYTEVNNLYNRGFDIGVNSITKGTADYFGTADVNTLVDEFLGQRKIISQFANIPIEDIKGSRIPHFALNGDVTYDALKKSGLEYDNSWTTNAGSPVYPYTLDYKSSQSCLVGKCPTSSFPGFWVLPIINNQGDNGYPCNVLFACIINGTSATEIRDWLKEQFDRHYSGKKAPLTFLLNAAWFKLSDNSFYGFELFLDYLATLSDVFVVSHAELQRWSKNPVPVGQYRPVVRNGKAPCNARICELPFGEQERRMGACVTCPDEYPWLGNPEGN